jgi:NADPH-dependent 2,4-dienoyl-CoA reductase/sulfur reductase-like enzyme
MELQPMDIPRGCLVPLAEAVKKVVRIPVATVGRIVDPQMAEEILAEGKADLITLGRALLADPEFPKKTQEGRAEDIRPCIGCLQGCRDRLYQGQPITCLVNASAGFEMEYSLNPAESRKRVLIIGGGPGGMEAARVAASRGHEVALFEKNSHLGGQFHLASLPPYKGEIKFFLQYLTRQIKKLRVKIYLNQEMTLDKLSQIQADVIILATGGSASKPEIPGVDRENVFSAWEILTNPEKVGQKVLVVGGGAVGTETAEFLADLQKEVTLIEMAKEVALDAERTHRKLLLLRLGEKGVRIRVMTQAQAIRKEGVEVQCNGQKDFIAADTVVMATGVKENLELEEPLRRLNVEFYKIGDCLKPRKAIEAIHEGFQVGMKI